MLNEGQRSQRLGFSEVGGGETEGVGHFAVESSVLMRRCLIIPGVSTH